MSDDVQTYEEYRKKYVVLLAGTRGESYPWTADVPEDELTEYDGSFGASRFGCLAEVVPVFGVDDEGSLRGLAFRRRHDGTVLVAYAGTQSIKKRVDDLTGSCHDSECISVPTLRIGCCVRNADAVRYP